MSRDVMLVQGDDWQAVYVEGELVDQGHDIDWMYVIAELGCNTYTQNADPVWLEGQGYFPDNINEVKFND